MEVEVDEPAPKTADDPEQEEEQEQEDEPPAPDSAAFGAPGENAEGAEQEEAPEADAEVEVPPSGSERTRSPSPSEATREVRVEVKRGSVTRRPLILAPATEAFPTVRVDSQGAWVRVREPPSQPSFVRRTPPPPRVQREAHEEEALSAPDPFDLPDDAWLEPHAFRESHTSRGFPRGVAVHSLNSGEETAGQGAAPGAPAQPRAPPTKRPFERGEVVEAEVHPPPPATGSTAGAAAHRLEARCQGRRNSTRERTAQSAKAGGASRAFAAAACGARGRGRRARRRGKAGKDPHPFSEAKGQHCIVAAARA